MLNQGACKEGMQVSRRALLSRIVQATGVSAGLLVLLSVGHWLLRPRRRTYPAIPAGHGQSIAPVELERSIATAGERHTWNPPWQDRLIRPPGALAEDDFLAACIRCYRCQDACEPAIRVVPTRGQAKQMKRT